MLLNISEKVNNTLTYSAFSAQNQKYPTINNVGPYQKRCLLMLLAYIVRTDISLYILQPQHEMTNFSTPALA